MSRVPSGPLDACLLLFTKPARPGRVKTRLVGALSAAQAAALHEAFLGDLCERLAAASTFALRLAWALEEGEEPPASSLPATRQRGRDLGERLFDALAGAAVDHALVAAAGSDHPELTAARVDDAFAALAAGAQVALGPASDGGYYLIALRREALRRTGPRLFAEIPWSTGDVLARTLDRCAELQLGVTLLAEESDVDTPADLERLAASLRAGGGPPCPRTAALLAEWEMLAPPPAPVPP
jgi:rSAM/selenodomain-associated transferase 1